MSTEHLFSYGTLQLEAVQLSTFGRRLTGTPDVLPGFEAVAIEIDDPTIVALSGKSQHSIATYTGRPGNTIGGTVYAVTPEELASADAYEVDAYMRVAVVLGSGTRAWVYVDARFAPPTP